MRVFDELRGTCASLSAAAKRSSVGSDLLYAISLSRARRPEYFLASLRRRLFFSIELFFAIWVSWVSAFEEARSSLPEREVECSEQGAGFVVIVRRGAHHDVRAPHLRRLVVIDLGKDDVLLDADAVVAASVEAFRIEPAEVAHSRQRDVHQAIKEVGRARLAQGDLSADRLVLAQLEGGDRLARLGDDRVLASDQGEVGG